MLGSVTYGLRITFYILAQRYLGAAKTSIYYAIAPFVGVSTSFLFLGEAVTVNFVIELLIMLLGKYLASVQVKDK